MSVKDGYSIFSTRKMYIQAYNNGSSSISKHLHAYILSWIPRNVQLFIYNANVFRAHKITFSNNLSLKERSIFTVNYIDCNCNEDWFVSIEFGPNYRDINESIDVFDSPFTLLSAIDWAIFNYNEMFSLVLFSFSTESKSINWYKESS